MGKGNDDQSVYNTIEKYGQGDPIYSNKIMMKNLNKLKKIV